MKNTMGPKSRVIRIERGANEKSMDDTSLSAKSISRIRVHLQTSRATVPPVSVPDRANHEYPPTARPPTR